jgi:glycerol-3-phosphate acyltransferase PlsY
VTVSESLGSVVVVVVGYLIGSVDFGVLVPRLLGVDIYTVGSGNPGASNVLRTIGRPAAAAVMVGDVLKGVAAAAIGDLVVGEAAGFAAGFAAVVGHCFPVWHRFKGGKGVATAAGMSVWLEPALGLVIAIVWAVTVAMTRRASVASLAVVALYVPLVALFGHRQWSLMWAGAVAVLVLLRHRDNIRRLAAGAERTLEEPG